MFDLNNNQITEAATRLSFPFESKATKTALATLVVPCYNEEDRLQPQIFLDYLKAHKDIEFLFVNDGSKDNTIAVLNKMHSLCPSRVHVLDLAQNGGKAEAVRQGLIRAQELGAEYVGYWDADLATPLNAIEDFLSVAKRLPELEVIYGARKAMLGHKIERKFSRRVISRSCATLARFAVKLPISDTQCGAKIFRNSDNLSKAIAEKFTAGWLFDVELFARLSRNLGNIENKFYEFALVEWTEIPGSKIDAKAVINSGFVMLKLIGEMRFKAAGNSIPQAI